MFVLLSCLSHWLYLVYLKYEKSCHTFLQSLAHELYLYVLIYVWYLQCLLLQQDKEL